MGAALRNLKADAEAAKKSLGGKGKVVRTDEK